MPKRKTTEEYKKEVENLTNNEYTILSEYKTQNDKILFKHLLCGKEYYSTPKNFNRGRRCSHCTNTKKPKSTEIFSKEVFKISNGEYKLISEYGFNNKDYVILRHNKCGNEFKIRPYNFLQGHGCPKCKKSRGENIIRNYLLNNNIKFQQEYEFPDLFHKNKERPLRFDFYLEDYNLLIEFDGKQHFEKSFYTDTDDILEDRKFKDKLKDKYCKEKGYSLLRINYKELKNIEKILKKELRFND